MHPLINQLKTALSAVTIVAALSFSAPALSAPTEELVAGSTSVKLSGDFVGALTSLQVQPAAVGRGSLAEGVAAFPISGGAIDLGTVRAEIIHQGGLSLTAGGTTVELTDFVITTLADRPVLTGLVTVNDDLAVRAPLFALQLPAVSTPLQPHSGSILTLEGVGVTLTSEAATALNQAFGVSAFRQGINIGTANVNAIVQ
jgi:hypothetical protein